MHVGSSFLKLKVIQSENVNYWTIGREETVEILTESYQLHLKQLNKHRRNHTEET